MDIIKVINSNFIYKPFLFIAIIIFIGSIILKKSIQNAITNAIKAGVGFLILYIGAIVFFKELSPMLEAIKDKFNLNLGVLDPYFGYTAAQNAIDKVGSTMTMVVIVLLIAFCINIIFVYFRNATKIRSIFVTGHIMFQQSAIALWIILFLLPNFNKVFVCISVGVILGTYWAVFSNMTIKSCQELTEGGGFAIGHQQMFGIWLADKIGGLFGKADNKVENIELPKFFELFNDNIMATAIILGFFFLIILEIVGPEAFLKVHSGYIAGQCFTIYLIEKILILVGLLSVLQLGMRMFISELIEVIQPIAFKAIDNPMLAVDCATVYGFSNKNVITLGFLGGLVGQLIAIIGLIIFKSPVIVFAGFAPLFFDNSVFAIFANKKGGIKAAIIVPFLFGIIQILGGALAFNFIGLNHFGGWIGNFDWDTIWPVIGELIKKFRYLGIIISVVVMLIIPQIQYIRNKKNYFKVVDDYE